MESIRDQEQYIEQEVKLRLLNSQYADIKDEFRKIERQFDKIDKRFEQVDSRFDKMESKIDKYFLCMIGLLVSCLVIPLTLHAFNLI